MNGTMTCDVCGQEVSNPIEIRLWDEELDEELEAKVCGGDCAKAWIDDDWDDSDTAAGGGSPVAPDFASDFAEGDEQPHPGWARSVEVAEGKSLRYYAHAATDPVTVAALDDLAKAAYAHFTSTTHASESEATR